MFLRLSASSFCITYIKLTVCSAMVPYAVGATATEHGDCMQAGVPHKSDDLDSVGSLVRHPISVSILIPHCVSVLFTTIRDLRI